MFGAGGESAVVTEITAQAGQGNEYFPGIGDDAAVALVPDIRSQITQAGQVEFFLQRQQFPRSGYSYFAE